MIRNDGTYALLVKALEGTQKRQEAMASNLANVNTRDFKANRVSFEEEMRRIVERNRTEGNNRSLARDLEKMKIRTEKDTVSRMNNDGNNVDVDREMSNMAANQIFHNALVQQLNTKYQMIRMVISDGR